MEKKKKTIELKALPLSFVSSVTVFLVSAQHNTTLAPHHTLDNGGRQSGEVAHMEAEEIQH